MMRRFTFSLALLLAGFIAGLIVTGRVRITTDPPAASAAATNTSGTATDPAALGGAAAPVAVAGMPGPDFTGIAGRGVKGVANISSVQVTRTPNSPFAQDPFFRYFFGDDEDAFGSRDRRSMSLGSGVIISADGYVVTNNHVVGENVRDITVSLGDKKEIHGKVIGVDPATDIALLKIQVSGLPALSWADSSQLKVGEWVLAIGSPFSLSQTVTAGIVSATGRNNMGFADYEDFIQTDAAINPGNSGGALINTRGDLVGINTGIYSQSGGYQGIGFAVPSNLARKVVEDLMKFGEVRRGSIGYLQVEKLTPQLAEEVGAKGTSGAVISRMIRNSEAYEAGLRPGDVIVGFNGTVIDDPGQFLRMVADAKIGTTATLKILRAGKSMDVKIAVTQNQPQRRRR